jgi:hypothetical protein
MLEEENKEKKKKHNYFDTTIFDRGYVEIFMVFFT